MKTKKQKRTEAIARSIEYIALSSEAKIEKARQSRGKSRKQLKRLLKK